MMNFSTAELFQLVSMPFIAALIGWFTNYVAVKMLFRPHNAVRVLGLSFQGVVPKRQRELALKIAETVETNLVSHRDIEAVIRGPEAQAQIEKLIESEIDSFLREKLSSIPMVGMFLQGELANQVKGAFLAQFRQSIPRLLEGLMEKLEGDLDVRKLVSDKIMAFDLFTLERIIYDISAKELRTIEILGGVLGFLVGLAQVAMMLAFR